MRPPLTGARRTRRPPDADPDALLVRALGTRQLTAAVFNYIVGVGIFGLPALVFAALGTAAPLAYLACAAIMTLVVLVFAAAGSRVSMTGGPYAYVEVALGPLPALLCGALNFLSDVSAIGAVAVLFGTSTASLLGVQGAAWNAALVIATAVAMAVMNIRGIGLGARIVEVSTVAKLLPMGLFVVAGLFFIAPGNLQLPTLPPARDFAGAIGVLIFAFTGIEGALVPSGEVRDPSRTVPRAAIAALVLVTVLYLGIQLVATGLLGAALGQHPDDPLAAAAAVAFGRAGRILMLTATALSAAGWMSGSILAAPRNLFALARDGFLPRRFAHVHPRFRTPDVAIAAYVTLGIALALSGTFVRLAIVSAAASLVVYFLSAAALIVMRRRDVRTSGEPFRLPGGDAVPILACAAIAWVVWQTLGRADLEALGIVVAATVVLYAARAARVRSAGDGRDTDAAPSPERV